MYDPTIGRWLSEDPIKDGKNWHAYVGNKPTTFVDHNGLNELYFQPNPDAGGVDLYYQDEFWYYWDSADPVYLGTIDFSDPRLIVRRGEHTVNLAEVQAAVYTWLSSPDNSQEWADWFKKNHYDFECASVRNELMRANPAWKQFGFEALDATWRNRAVEAQGEIRQLSYDLLIFYVTAPAEVLQPLSQIQKINSAKKGFPRTPSHKRVWTLGPGDRGDVIEAVRGGNLPKGFKTIDRFHDGVATSIKSIDLNATSYKIGDPSAKIQSCRKLGITVRGYIDKMVAFQGAKHTRGEVEITASQITSRQLELVIPANSMSGMQKATLDAAIDYGKARGVDVIVLEIK